MKRFIVFDKVLMFVNSITMTNLFVVTQFAYMDLITKASVKPMQDFLSFYFCCVALIFTVIVNFSILKSRIDDYARDAQWQMRISRW